MATETMNLSDDGSGMVPLSTSFVQNESEKNVGEKKETTTMDSTPINDIMMDPPMMNDEPRMQSMQPPLIAQERPTNGANGANGPVSKNPMNLTDDQIMALVAGACASLAVSKPVQDRLATSIPRFLNDQGGRSMVGLASTGVVAAIVFYFVKDYVIKN
jgi:hypothetical protein